jgi:Spy/CpxP family protein refolding chaperone
MKHAGKMSRRNLLLAGALLGALGLVGIVPWCVSAQEEANREKKVEGKFILLSKEMVQELGMTETQLKRLGEIHESCLKEVRKVLTADQLKRLDRQNDHIAEMTASLGLTEAQVAHIKGIHAETEKRVQAVKEDGTLSNHEKEVHVKEIMEQQETLIHQSLTPEQQKKMEELHQKAAGQENSLNLTEEQQQKLEAAKKQIVEQASGLEHDETLSKEEKEARMKAFVEKLHTQLLQILTPEQLKQMEEQHRRDSAREQETKAHEAGGPYSIANLERLGDLTDAQKTKIRTLYEKAKKQSEQVLTADQKRKIQEMHAKEKR